MAHYAKVLNGIVTKVIEADADYINAYIDDSPGAWVESVESERLASIGDTWDGSNFYPPKPYASWIWNSDNIRWESAVDYPDNGNPHRWDEETNSWVEVDPQPAGDGTSPGGGGPDSDQDYKYD